MFLHFIHQRKIYNFPLQLCLNWYYLVMMRSIRRKPANSTFPYCTLLYFFMAKHMADLTGGNSALVNGHVPARTLSATVSGPTTLVYCFGKLHRTNNLAKYIIVLKPKEVIIYKKIIFISKNYCLLERATLFLIINHNLYYII